MTLSVRGGACCLLILVLLAPLSLAGTADEPEITDPADDQATVVGDVPVCPAPPDGCQFRFGDVLAAWVTEDEEHFVFHIRTSGGTGGGAVGPAATTSYLYHFYGEVDGISFTASARSTAASLQAEDDAVTASSEGDVLVLLVPREALGDPPVGAVLSGLYVETFAFMNTDTATLVTDRAPDSGFGSDYEVQGFVAGEAAPVPVITLTADNATVESQVGGAAAFNLTAQLAGNTTSLAEPLSVAFGNGTLEGNWSLLFDPTEVTLEDNTTLGNTTVLVFVPADAAPGDYTLNFTATALDGNVTAFVEVTVVVVDEHGHAADEGQHDLDGAADEGRGIPGPGLAAVLAVLAVGRLGAVASRAGRKDPPRHP